MGAWGTHQFGVNKLFGDHSDLGHPAVWGPQALGLSGSTCSVLVIIHFEWSLSRAAHRRDG